MRIFNFHITLSAALAATICLGTIAFSADYDSQASLPNLAPVSRTGWSYPIVPRNSNNSTSVSAGLPSELIGDVTSTYLNFVYTNSGLASAYSHETGLYIDGNQAWYGTVSWLNAGAISMRANIGPTLVKGGRHTLWYSLDTRNSVIESDESDNAWGRQFVWSPYVLAAFQPVTRSAPALFDATGPVVDAYPNCDGYAFATPTNASTGWTAVAVLPTSAAANYDVRLYDIGSYGGSEYGFDDGFLADSQDSAGYGDFVLVNNNIASSGTYYAGVLNRNASSSSYSIEQSVSSNIAAGYVDPVASDIYELPADALLDVYEVYLPVGDRAFLLHQISGTCNLGFSLYPADAPYASKGDYVAGGFADANGDGGDESIQVAIDHSGWYGLAVWKSGASDNSKTASYQIIAGPPSIEVTYPTCADELRIGSTQTIRWTSMGIPAQSVRIEVSGDEGTTWLTIDPSAPNTGSYNWTVSGPASGYCLIRVTSNENPTYAGQSLYPFVIGGGSVTGQVALQNIPEPQKSPIYVEVRLLGSGVVESHWLWPGTNGAYSFITSAASSCDIAMISNHFLRQTLPADLGQASASLGFNLTNGDVDGDNEITSTDLSILGLSLGSSLGDESYSADADLDEDSEITSTDLSILGIGLGAVGDE